MAFDDVFKSLGDFGRYQKQIYALLLLTVIPVGIHFLAHVFIAADTDYWCKKSALNSFNCSEYGLSTDECVNVTSESQERHCSEHQFDVVDSDGFVNLSWSTVECSDGWSYDTSQYHTTIIQDWNLVCGDAAKSAIASSILFVGVLMGSLISGSFADHIGRKKVLFICLSIVTVTGTLAAVSPNYWFFCLMRFCIGAGSIGIYIMVFVISTEIVGPKPRTFTGIAADSFFLLGCMLLAVMAYFIRSWRHLQLVASVPILLTFILYPFIPESPRWLVTQRRYQEATDILKRIAKVNGTELPPEFSDPIEMATTMKHGDGDTNSRRHTFVDLVRTPNLRKTSINLFYNWMVNGFVYYGLSLGTSSMGVNDYVAMFVSGAVGLPAIVFAIYTAGRFGRRRSTSYVMIIGGVALFTTLFLSKGVALLSVAMMGKFCITSSFNIIYIFAAEQFPTPVRAVGVGCCSVAARVGAIMAPQILFIGKLWEPLPSIVFSVMSVSAGLLVLLLPETLNAQLPETLEDGENFGKKSSKEDEKAYSNIAQVDTAA